MDKEQRMYKLKNGSDTAKWAAEYIEALESAIANHNDDCKTICKARRATKTCGTWTHPRECSDCPKNWNIVWPL